MSRPLRFPPLPCRVHPVEQGRIDAEKHSAPSRHDKCMPEQTRRGSWNIRLSSSVLHCSLMWNGCEEAKLSKARQGAVVSFFLA